MNIPYPRKTAALVIVGLSSLQFAPPAFADETKNADEMAARADANGDGNIEWSEIVTFRTKTFDRLDRNGDDVINAQDTPPLPFRGRFNKALDKLQTDFDADGDQEITRAEMMDAPAPLFEAGDVNGDGILTAEEMAALRTSAAAKTASN